MKRRVENDRIYFGERFSVGFQRTLRIPDDGQSYPLPPGLGLFPIHRVADYHKQAPASWNFDDLFIPMYRREALWLGFQGASWKPNAVKVGTGRVNAVSGRAWDEELHSDPQDYLVCPQQPWLDGINAGAGFIRQFVAVPLGEGYTIEAQVIGSEDSGGIQLLVYEPKPGKFPDQAPQDQITASFAMRSPASVTQSSELGLGVGGRMTQKIYPDPYGIETWDIHNNGEVIIHLVDSHRYEALTGLRPPPSPVTAQAYAEHGLPWFELYDEAFEDIAAASNLSRLESIKDLDAKKGTQDHEDSSIDIDSSQIKKLR
jgi:hypothetical protein